MMGRGKIHVLLVEDDPTQAALTRSMLRQQFDGALRLWETTHVEVALSHLEDPSVEVVLLDLDLPDSHGVATVERVAKAAPKVPIVVFTGHDSLRMREAALKRGAHAYLVKGQADGVVLEAAVAGAARHRNKISEPAGNTPEKARTSRAPHTVVPRGTGQRVLLVEGRPALRETLAHILRNYGYRVHAAVDGNEAVEHFISAPDEVNVVVAELFLPVVGGATLRQAVSRLRPSIPIIISDAAASGASGHEHSGAVIGPGSLHILQRPHTYDGLLRLLHQVLSPASEP